MGVDVVADGQLARRDDTLRLEADVEQHLVAVDLDHATGDDVTVVELDDGGVDRVGERLTAQVVEHDQLVLAFFLLLDRFASAASGSVASGVVLTSASGAAAVASPLSSGTVAIVASVTS